VKTRGPISIEDVFHRQVPSPSDRERSSGRRIANDAAEGDPIPTARNVLVAARIPAIRRVRNGRGHG
jgi:hypothetical protein